MGRKRETIQCSKHLLSTRWVPRSGVQGSHSASLRADWLTGREEGKEAMGLSMIHIPDSMSASPLDKLQHKRSRPDCRRDFQEMRKGVE